MIYNKIILMILIFVFLFYDIELFFLPLNYFFNIKTYHEKKSMLFEYFFFENYLFLNFLIPLLRIIFNYYMN